MSPTSENPVQNKVIYEALNNILPEETAEGNPIGITDASGLLAKSCEVSFSPIQSGSGDPSPINIRPISGWDILHLYQNTEQTETPETTHTATFPDTVYGGKVDFVSGEESANMAVVDLGNLTWKKHSSKNFFYVSLPLAKYETGGTYLANALCEQYKVVNPVAVQTTDYSFAIGTYHVSYVSLYIRDSRYSESTASEFKTAMSGVQLCYELATPQEITLTPDLISLLKGNNTLWTDGDNITLKYSADIKEWVLAQLQS